MKNIYTHETIKYLKSFGDTVFNVFREIWTTKRGLFSISAAVAAVYIGIWLITGEARNPLWCIWSALSGSSAFSVSAAIFMMRDRRLKRELDDNLLSAPGNTCTVTTIDGANIGEIDEASYLTAKYVADNCFSTKVLQSLNFLWVAISIFLKTLIIMPALLTTGIIVIHYSGSQGALSEITLGQLLESDSVIMSFHLALVVSVMATMIRGLTNAPGYKNFYELRLRLLLSKELPNIANANGFSVSRNVDHVCLNPA